MIYTTLLIKLRSISGRNRKLAGNTVWLLGTEIVAKVSRLLTVIALSISLTTVEYGAAMLTVACHEIIRIAMRYGVGAQIVQCEEQHLTRFAQTGKAIQWLVGTILCIIQCLAAYIIGYFYDHPDSTVLIQIMSLTYLLFPVVAVQVFLVQRAGNLRFISIRNGICLVTENIAVAGMAIGGGGLWSLVAGKFIFAIMWVALFLRAPVVHYGAQWHTATARYLLITSSQLFGTEAVRSMRQHIDIFIAGKVLSAECLGIYAFAKSAGVGLSQSLSHAFNSALYPYLCQQLRDTGKAALSGRLVGAIGAVGSLFLLQALISPMYIPLLFDHRWDNAIETVTLLCVAAFPVLFIDTFCNVIRANGAYTSEFRIRLLCTSINTIIVIALHPQTPQAFGLAILYGALASLAAVLIEWFVSASPSRVCRPFYHPEVKENEL